MSSPRNDLSNACRLTTMNSTGLGPSCTEFVYPRVFVSTPVPFWVRTELRLGLGFFGITGLGTRNNIYPILVMGDGSVAQFGSPYELLCDTEGGILTDLVEETGPASRDRLFEMAR